MRRVFNACDVVSNAVKTRGLDTRDAFISDLVVEYATIGDLEVSGSIIGDLLVEGSVTVTGDVVIQGDSILNGDVTIEGTLVMCDGAAKGTLLVGNGALPNVMECFDPVADGAVAGQVLQYTGTGTYGMTWSGLSMLGVCTDVHGLTVGTGAGTAFCVQPDPGVPYPYGTGAGQILSYDGAPTQTPAGGPGAVGTQFGPPATGHNALVAFDSNVLTGGMPSWTPVPTLDNSLLYFDSGLPATVWLAAGGGAGNQYLCYDGTDTTWVTGSIPPVCTADGDILRWDTGTNAFVCVTAPTAGQILQFNPTVGVGTSFGPAAPAPANDNILVYSTITSQYETLASSGTSGDGLVLDTATGALTYEPVVCQGANEIPVRLAGPGYGCITAPTVASQILCYDGTAAPGGVQWSTAVAPLDSGMVLGVDTGTDLPVWRASGGVNGQVLTLAGGIPTWAAPGGLPTGTNDGDMLYWDTGGAAFVVTSTAAATNSVMTFNAASDADWSSGSTTAGDGLVVNGGVVSYAPLVCQGENEIPIRVSGVSATGYTCITAPIGAGGGNVLAFNGSGAPGTSTVTWSTAATMGALETRQVLGYDVTTQLPIWRGAGAGTTGDVLTLDGSVPPVPIWSTPSGGSLTDMVSVTLTGGTNINSGAIGNYTVCPISATNVNIGTVFTVGASTIAIGSAGTYLSTFTVNVTRTGGSATTTQSDVYVQTNPGMVRLPTGATTPSAPTAGAAFPVTASASVLFTIGAATTYEIGGARINGGGSLSTVAGNGRWNIIKLA